MTRYLVVYYSWSGKTAKVAQALAQRLSADVEEIREPGRRSGLFAFFRSAFEAAKQKTVDISPPAKDAGTYDVLVVGTPVWAQDMASPVRSYLTREGPKCRQIAVFCTMGGSGGEQAVEHMGELAGRAPLADLVIPDSAMKTGAWAALADDFVRRIRAKEPARADAHA